MPFQLSAGVNISEFDISTVIPTVSSTVAALSGVFRWGPVNERVRIDSETNLAVRMGTPSNLNPSTWFTAANFLAYGNALELVRVANVSTSNASISAFNSYALAANGTVANVVAQIVLNKTDYEVKDGTFDTDIMYLAKFPGAMGDSLRIAQCDSANQFQSNLSLTTASVNGSVTFNIGNTVARVTMLPQGAGTANTTNTYAISTAASLAVGDLVAAGNATIGTQYLKVANVTTVSVNSTASFFDVTFEDPYRLATAYVANTVPRYWEFYHSVEDAPGQSEWMAAHGNTAANDELHVVVVDEKGKFTAAPGTILEVYRGMSRATDAQNADGGTNYYKNVINQQSKYVWWATDRSGAVSNTGVNLINSTAPAPLDVQFSGGSDGYDEITAPLGLIASGYQMFQSAEDVDISIIMQGLPKGGTNPTSGAVDFQLANYIIDNICELRKDCIAVVSPPKATVVNNFGSEGNAVVAWRNSLSDGSYGVTDSGWKYQYDRYNDVWRWVPLNGDIAGLCVRTDATNDAWWSPAGFNRGQIKNIARLAYNPRQADRDFLYKNGVNPVVTFPGKGTILYGDKTLQAKPSAFDRINVRRLFIVLEKAIATASKYMLFEFNDAFTRAQFKNMVNPYLKDIQGRRGITDFLVVCDESNNTGEVIDKNGFVGDIYVKPARSINFIQLNFFAVGTSIQFSEVVGKSGAGSGV